MRLKWILKFILINLTLIGASITVFALTQESIPVIGTSKNGTAQVVEVSKKDYSDRLTASTSTVNESLIEAVDLASHSATQWHLRSIAVGLGVNMEFGIGNMRIGALPRVRLIYTNSTNPPLP